MAAPTQCWAFYGRLGGAGCAAGAEWMVACFTMGVLNTTTLSWRARASTTPLASGNWDPGFTAAYFDQNGSTPKASKPLIFHQEPAPLQGAPGDALPALNLGEPPRKRFAPALTTSTTACACCGASVSTSALIHGGDQPVGSALSCPTCAAPALQLLAHGRWAYGSFSPALAARISSAVCPRKPKPPALSCLVPRHPRGPGRLARWLVGWSHALADDK